MNKKHYIQPLLLQSSIHAFVSICTGSDLSGGTGGSGIIEGKERSDDLTETIEELEIEEQKVDWGNIW